MEAQAESYRNHDRTQLISIQRGQTALLCCAGITKEVSSSPVHHCQLGCESDQLQGGRDIKKDQPLRYQHLLSPPRKLKLCSFDVKTELILNPSLLNQGNSISFSYGNTVSTRAIHREKWFSRRLELSQRQGTVSSVSKALTEQKLEPWLYGPNPNHFLVPQGWRVREQKSSTPFIVHGVSLTPFIQL